MKMIENKFHSLYGTSLSLGSPESAEALKDLLFLSEAKPEDLAKKMADAGQTSTWEKDAATIARFLVTKNPGMGSIVMWVPRKFEGGNGVARTDGRYIYFGPGFWKFSGPEKAFIYAHEVLHVAFRHVPRMKKMGLRQSWEFRLYNIAVDAIVNNALSKLPFLKHPENLVTFQSILTPEELELGVQRWSAEKLYNHLLQKLKRDKMADPDYQKGYKDGFEEGQNEKKSSDAGYEKGREDGTREGLSDEATNQPYDPNPGTIPGTPPDMDKDSFEKSYQEGYQDGYEKARGKDDSQGDPGQDGEGEGQGDGQGPGGPGGGKGSGSNGSPGAGQGGSPSSGPGSQGSSGGSSYDKGFGDGKEAGKNSRGGQGGSGSGSPGGQGGSGGGPSNAPLTDDDVRDFLKRNGVDPFDELSPGESGRGESSQGDGSASKDAVHPDGATEETRSRVWNSRIQRARGTDPSGFLGEMSADLPEPKVPWEQVLRTWLNQAVAPETEETWNRPSRRTGIDPTDRRNTYFEPGFGAKKGIRRIGVAVDNSGSISLEELYRFAAEIDKIKDKTGCEVYLVACDAEVNGTWLVPRGKKLSALLRSGEVRLNGGGGGTHFDPAVKKLNEMKCTVNLYFTDLYGPCTLKSKSPMIWAVTSTEEDVPYGRLLKIEK